MRLSQAHSLFNCFFVLCLSWVPKYAPFESFEWNCLRSCIMLAGFCCVCALEFGNKSWYLITSFNWVSRNRKYHISPMTQRSNCYCPVAEVAQLENVLFSQLSSISWLTQIMEKNGQLRVETNYLVRILFFVVMSASLGLCNVSIKPGECMIVFFASHVIGHLSFEIADSHKCLGILE